MYDVGFTFRLALLSREMQITINFCIGEFVFKPLGIVSWGLSNFRQRELALFFG